MWASIISSLAMSSNWLYLTHQCQLHMTHNYVTFKFRHLQIEDYNSSDSNLFINKGIVKESSHASILWNT